MNDITNLRKDAFSVKSYKPAMPRKIFKRMKVRKSVGTKAKRASSFTVLEDDTSVDNARVAASAASEMRAKEAKALIIEAKRSSKSGDLASAAALYEKALALLPENAKLQRKLEGVRRKIAVKEAAMAMRAQSKESSVEDMDDPLSSIVDMKFASTPAPATPCFSKYDVPDVPDAPVFEMETDASADAESEKKEPFESDVQFDLFGSTAALVFSRAVSLAAEKEGLCLSTPGYGEMFALLEAVHVAEKKLSWYDEEVYRNSDIMVERKRVRFCSYDLTTVTPPPSSTSLGLVSSGEPCEDLFDALCDISAAADAIVITDAYDLVMAGIASSCESDSGCRPRFRKAAAFYHRELSKVGRKGQNPFDDRLLACASSLLRYHLRCALNRPERELYKRVKRGQKVDEILCGAERQLRESSLHIMMDAQSGSLVYNGEDVAATVHSALWERHLARHVLEFEVENEGEKEAKWAFVESHAFLLAVLRHPRKGAVPGSVEALERLGARVKGLAGCEPLHVLASFCSSMEAFRSTLEGEREAVLRLHESLSAGDDGDGNDDDDDDDVEKDSRWKYPCVVGFETLYPSFRAKPWRIEALCLLDAVAKLRIDGLLAGAILFYDGEHPLARIRAEMCYEGGIVTPREFEERFRAALAQWDVTSGEFEERMLRAVTAHFQSFSSKFK
eukprot:g1402.t1